MHVLNIDVPDDLAQRWCRYLAPAVQPFFVRPEDDLRSSVPEPAPTLSDDLRCTYTGWRIREKTRIVWLDEASFHVLPRADRARLVRRQVELGRGAVPSVRRWQDDFDADVLRAQADGHRFVWWPSLLDTNPEPVLRAQVEDGQLDDRHREVRAETWRGCRAVLPNAREIVGRFPESSGPNCFGTTLVASGYLDVATRVLQGQFESFLAERCAPGGHDGDAGTVLVWRDRDGQPCHSAVTIGDGWAIEKPAETWWTPTIVADARQLVRINRAVGLKLERHRLRSTPGS